jgi:hypothetical protein
MASAPPVVTPLVTRRFALAQKLDDLKAEILAVDDSLIVLGAGGYADEEGRKLIVVAASEGKAGEPSYVLPDESAARALAGEDFKSLFDRVVSFVPCAGFALVVPKFLTEARARKLVDLCFVPGKPATAKKAYVRAG